MRWASAACCGSGGRGGLNQEELAEAAGLSPRSVSDLERGINRTARKDTAELWPARSAWPRGLPVFVSPPAAAPRREVLAALRGAAAAEDR